MIAVEDHVHALEDKTCGIVLERQDALAAQDVLALGGDQILHPRKELVGIQRLVGAQRDRLHVFIMVVLEAVAMAMMMVAIAVIVTMIVIVVMMVMIVLLVVLLQELRLDIEDTVEVEGVAAEYLAGVDPGALGTVQPRVRIDAADARLDLAQLFRRNEIGLVDQDDVGERNLIFGLDRVLQAILQPLGIEIGRASCRE